MGLKLYDEATDLMEDYQSWEKERSPQESMYNDNVMGVLTHSAHCTTGQCIRDNVLRQRK